MGSHALGIRIPPDKSKGLQVHGTGDAGHKSYLFYIDGHGIFNYIIFIPGGVLMKHTGYFIVALVFLLGLCIVCGCSTQEPAVDSGSGAATDAGLRIITEDLPPLTYAGADGKATGQATEVVNGILARLNQKAEIEILPWSEGYNLALAGPRVVLFPTGRTDERELLFKWVGPIASSCDITFYARTGSGLEINSLEAAKKVGSIGVREDARYQFLLENGFDNIATCTNDTECLLNLIAGTTDLWLGSSVNSADIARREGIDPSAFKAVYTIRTVPFYIAFSIDTPDTVIADWQGALDAMKRDGTFDAIGEKYGVITSAITAVSVSDEAMADFALEIVAAETDSQLKAILRSFEVLAVTTEVQSGEWQNIRSLLAVLEENEPDARLWYALPDGSYYTIVDGLTSSNLKGRSYFPGVLAGKESVGTVVVSYSTGKNTAIVAVPVKSSGEVTGVLGASVYLDTMTDTLRGRIPEPFVYYAIDTENQFAIHSDKGQITRNITMIGPDSSFGKAIDKIRAQDSGTVEYDDGGIHYMARFRSDPFTGWRFVVAWPKVGTT
jgi:ABC-type amino acid transport substrate-binding protein